MMQFSFLPNIEFMEKLLASQLQKFAYQPMDSTLYREMTAHLNETLDARYGSDFDVVGVRTSKDFITLEVSFTLGNQRSAVLIQPDAIHAATFSMEEEFDRMLEVLARGIFDLIELGRNIHDKRLVNVANTQFELGFMALRKATKEIPDGTF